MGLFDFVDDVLGTDLTGKKAMDVANRAQQQATDKSVALQQDVLDFQKEMYGQQREDIAPWMEAGRGALSDLVSMYQDPSKTMEVLGNDPAYQFRMQEGQKALERSAAARGGLSSGGTMKALARYGQGLASEEYNNRWNRLAGLAGMGQGAAGQTAAASGQMGANMGQYGQNLTSLYTNMANATGANAIAANSGLNNMIGQVAAGVGYAISDERLKKNIKPIPQADIDEFKAVIKPYFYEYKDKEIGVGEFAGVMAQDLEKTRLGKLAVFEDNKGNKVVNFNKLLPIFIASMGQGA